MRQDLVVKHDVVPALDADEHPRPDAGFPAGGATTATGLSITWQAGPTGGHEPTGALVETVILAALDRLRFFQTAKPAQEGGRGRFWCEENERAIEALAQARAHLEARDHDRELRGVEGTYQA